MSADLSRRAMMTAAASIAATPVVAVLPANQPAPPAGALISCISREDREVGEYWWHEAALANAARALVGMGDERLPPFANEAHDVDLANATFRVSNADLALNRLYRKHGDDADSRGDYQRVDAACDEELDILANTPSRTSRGIIAKAEALYESRLIEDYERHGSIANSLAADILRYFGV